MSAPQHQKWFDTDAELQKLRGAPPKAPKVPKVEPKISHYSHFRWGQGENLHNPHAKKRPFLPRPLGKEDALDPWEVWTPLFDWLIEHHPDHFHAVCDAEDALHRMERQGITSGEAYEAACQDLYVKFETARRLKLKAEVKVWIQ